MTTAHKSAQPAPRPILGDSDESAVRREIFGAKVRTRLGQAARTLRRLAESVERPTDRVPRWAHAEDLARAAGQAHRDVSALYEAVDWTPGDYPGSREARQAMELLVGVAACVTMSEPERHNLLPGSGYLFGQQDYLDAAVELVDLLYRQCGHWVGLEPEPGEEDDAAPQLEAGHAAEASGSGGEVGAESPARVALQLVAIALRMLRDGLGEDCTHAAHAAHAMALAADAPAEVIFTLEAATDADRYGTADAQRTFLLLARRELEDWMDRTAAAVG